MNNQEPTVSMRGITKAFMGKIVANKDVNLDIYRGQILSLLGENGSGKTTLMNMLSGIYAPDAGQIFIDGKEVHIRSPKDALDLGIGMIHQHFMLVDVMTATENIILGLHEGNLLDLKAASARIKEICDRYGFDLDPDQKIYNMSVSQKQTVEIVKVLYRKADILILDEPTAVLTPQETDRLFDVLRNMKQDGKAIIIITHKLNEVLKISDRVDILRAGEYVGSLKTSETNAQEMTDMMVGHAVELNIRREEPVDPRPKIQVKDLTVRSSDGVLKLDKVSFEARSGEILGVAGVSGSGQKELLEAIAGLQNIESGEINFLDKEDQTISLLGKTPLDIQNLGIALSFVPEDRLGMGLLKNMDITDNVLLRSFRNGSSIFANRKKPKKLAGRIVDELSVVTPSLSTPIRRLSGGNVQKILVGREIASHPTVLLTAYAVRGLDINSSYMIYDLINQQKERGVSVIYVGEDLDVLLQLADRILVLCAGKVSGIVDARTTTKQEVGLMMTSLGGGKANE